MKDSETNFSYQIALPWPKYEKGKILPIFIPFKGCPARCVFCSQEQQTGVSGARSISTCLQNALDQLKFYKCVPELAFYGGTFTGLNPAQWSLCLDFAARLYEKGLISGFRCSTRPDFVEAKRLHELKAAGCKTVELGIQTFAEEPLKICKRFYDSQEAVRACIKIKEAGLRLGIQLMPGMPKSRAEDFIDDVKKSLGYGADLLRFYPCLVLANTELAEMWTKGVYMPLDLDIAINLLAKGWRLAMRSQVNVIRMGLAPEAGLNILAGPWHPALGSRVQALGLYSVIAGILKFMPQKKYLKIALPSYCQGFFWGWQKELKTAWLKLGIDGNAILFWKRNLLRIVSGA